MARFGSEYLSRVMVLFEQQRFIWFVTERLPKSIASHAW
jgi:hypothetical protein